MSQRRKESFTQPQEAWRVRAKRLAPYLPGTVVRQILSDQSPHIGQPQPVQTAVLFADLSGFTPMSEQLAQDGRRGAETLNRTLLLTFTTLINAIHNAGGDVCHFHGDAMLAYFPDEDGQAAMRALACAQFMQRLMSTSLATVNVKLENGRILPFHLSMRVGVAYGPCSVSVLSVGNEQLEFVLSGAPVDAAVAAEAQATAGQVVAEQAVLQRAGLPANSPFRLVDELLPIPTGSNLFTWGAYDISDFRRLANFAPRFIPAPLVERLANSDTQAIAEHRTVSTMFVRFSGIDLSQPEGVAQLQEYVTWAQAVLARFGGANARLNRILTGDKGNHLHIIFGAPTAPAAPDQAVRCALALQAERPTFIQNQQIGLATGEAFACAVGANKRREYTVVGRVVNLSARLTQQAEADTIVVDGNTADFLKNQFRLQPKGSVPLKGMQTPTPIFRVLGEQSVEAWQNHYAQWQNKPHGWDNEANLLRDLLAKAVSGQGQLILLQTVTGMGQEHLLETAVTFWAENQGVGIVGAGRARSQQQPLSGWPSLRDGLEAKDVSQLAKLLCEQAQKRPLLLILENLQHADSKTLALIQQLAPRLSDYPLCLLLTASINQQEIPENAHRLAIGDLPPARIRAFLHTLLDGSTLPQSVETYLGLQDETGNDYPLNPYLLQITLEEMWSQAILQRDRLGNITVDDVRLATMQVPNSISMVLQASLDLLPSRTVSLLQIGSVIGRHFSVAALTAVSGSRTAGTSPIPLLLRRVAELGIIQPIPENDEPAYRFQQILLQRVLYQGLPFARRQTIHATLAEYFRHAPQALTTSLQMAEHYRRAGQRPEAVRQLIAHGDQAFAASDLLASLKLFDTAQKLLQSPPNPAEQKTAALLTARQLPLLFALGHFYQAQALAQHGGLTPDQKNRWLADIASAQGNDKEVIQHLTRISTETQTAADSYLLGRTYLRLGNRKAANGRFQTVLAHGDFSQQTLAHLGLAELFRQQNALPQTDYHLSRAQACIPQIQAPLALGKAWLRRAKILRRLGQLIPALEAIEACTQTLATQGPYWHVLGLLEQTVIHILQGKKQVANATLRQAFAYLLNIDPCTARLVAQRLSKRLQQM